MSDVSTWFTATKDLAIRPTGPTFFRKQFVSGTALAQNDVVLLAQIPQNMVVSFAKIYQSGTLGASATAQLRRGTTALTAATTQGAAGGASSIAAAPDEPNTSAHTDSLNILIAGAAAGTSATITVEATLWHVTPGQDL